MAREVEFYAPVDDLLPVLEPLFARRATAFFLASNTTSSVAVASSVAELRQGIERGTTQFEIGVGEKVYPPLVDSVFNQPTGAIRYFFVDKVGGPFLEVRVPEHGMVDGVLTLRPGSIATKGRYYTDRSYRNEIPDESMRHAFNEAARRVLKKNFPSAVVYEPSEGMDGYAQFQVFEKLSYELVAHVQAEVSSWMAPYGGVCESWGVLH